MSAAAINMDEPVIFDGLCHQLPGFDTPIGPISNMTDFYIVHRLEIECAKACLEMGIEPPFWRSANVPGGDAFNKKNLEKYNGRIKML